MALVLLAVTTVVSVDQESGVVERLAREFLEQEARTWQELSENENEDGDREAAARRALARFIEWAELRDRLIGERRPNGDEHEQWLRPVERYERWRTAWSDLHQLQVVYERWRRAAAAEGGAAQRRQWLEMARAVRGSDAARYGLRRPLPELLVSAHAHLNERALLNNLVLRAIDERDSCRLDTSPNRLVYELYEMAALAQLQGHVVLQWTRALLATEDEGREDELRAAGEESARYLMVRSAERRLALEALRAAPRDLWRCDPVGGHTNGTYAALTRLLQAYVENERDMSVSGSCMQDCSAYQYAHSVGCYHGLCNRQSACRGRLLDCRYVYKDMTVCEAERGSSRRYDYIEYDNRLTYGRSYGCPSSRTIKADSWWRWLFWHCSYCLCLCDEEGSPRSDRRWSLQPALTDAEHHMVAVGVRIVKRTGTVYLQLRQARLMVDGRADPTTAEWVPLPADDGTHEGTDYHTMTYERRGLDLDDVQVPTGYLVTGARWRVLGSHLNLEVRATAANRTAGRLDSPTATSHWVSVDSTLGRQQLRLKAPDEPTRQTQPSRVDSQPESYVQFTHSDLEKDAGQTTVPYLDVQPVAPEPPVPLQGLGMLHKGQQGYGGYVAPKVITIDYTAVMQ